MNDQNHKPPAPIVSFKHNLNVLIENKELALPSNVTAESFRNAAVVAAQDNPEILNADQASLFKSIRRAAASGLVPDGREGALVTFKTKDKASGRYIDKVQFMPMVFGLMKMARRSGTVKEIRAHIVYQGEVDQDRFKYTIGDEEKLEHDPILFGDRGAPVGAYAIAVMKDGSLVREFMAAEDIDTVRRAGSSQRVYRKGEKPKVSDEPIGIWKDWWSEMWKKTVIRRITKRLDLSADDVRRITEDDEFEGLRDVTPRGVPDEKPTAFARKAKGLPLDDDETPPETPEESDEGHAEADGVEDAEIVPDGAESSAQHDPEPMTHINALDLSQAFPGSDEYDEGVKAFQGGGHIADCPYLGKDDGKATDWCGGFQMAAKSKMEEDQ